MAKKYGRIAGRGGRDRLTALLLACAMVACSWTVSVHAERDGSSLSGAERTSAESGAEASSAVSGGSEPAAASDGESGAQSAAGSSAPEVSSGETASSEGQISSGETASSEGRASSGETVSSEAHAPYELKQQKLAAAVYADEKLETKSDDKTAITVEGSLPAGAAVKAYPVRVKLGGAAVLAAYDITVYGPDGAAYQPEKPVRVSISAPKLKDAPSVDVYHVQDAPAGEDEAAAGASEPRDDGGNGAPVEQATVEQNGSEKAMKATKVAEGVKPESETVEFQAEGFSIYVVTGEGSSTAGSKVAVNDSTNPSYIKMDTETQTTVKANVRDIPTQGVHAEAITVKNATVSWTSNNMDVVAIAPSGSPNINLPSASDFTATFTAKGDSLEEGATATATVTVSFTYTLHHAGYSSHFWGYYPEWDDSSTIETAQIHVTIQKPSGETGTGSGETKHEKTVVKRSGDNAATPSGDPIYDLTLDFSGTMQQFTSKQDVDIVFVVDVSGSMDNPIKSGSSKSRIQAAREAINTLQTAAGPNDKDLNARYALVCFSGDGDYWKTDKAYDDAMIQQEWTGSVDTEKIQTANDSGGAGGTNGGITGTGTNYEAGLLLADNLIANDHSSAKKLVIFLSDGVPTYRYDTNGYTDGNGTNDNERSHVGENLENAVTQAQNLKSHHADYFFAVGCGELGSGQSILQSLTAVFGDMNGDNVLIATDEGDLNRAFTNIINSTTTIACKNVSIVDALSSNIEIYNPNSTLAADLVTVWEGETDVTSSLQDFSPNILYDSNNRVLTVSLGENYTANPAYTYKVTYPVVASESAKTAYSNDGDNAYANSTADSGTGTYAGELGFFTNKKADISDEHSAPSGGTYVTYQKVDDQGNEVGVPYYEAYPMPVIKIESLSLTLKKTDGNNFLSGSAFTLYVKAEDAWMSVGTYQIDKDDGVAVSGLINGKSYKLEETTVPAGYLKADDIYFTVSGYQIKPTDAQGQTLAGWPKHMSFENNALTVANDKIYTLPVTGGAGNLPFRVAGAAILAGAAVGLGFRLRRGKKKKGGPPQNSP